MGIFIGPNSIVSSVGLLMETKIFLVRPYDVEHKIFWVGLFKEPTAELPSSVAPYVLRLKAAHISGERI